MLTPKKNITKVNNKFNFQAAMLIMAISATILLTTIALIVVLSSPVADDFARLYLIPKYHILGYIYQHYTTVDGRFANAILMALSIGIFGHSGLRIAIILVLITFILALSWIIYQLIDLEKNNIKQRIFISVTVASFILSCAIYSLPSIFDSIAWFNSVCIYLAGLSFTTVMLGFLLYCIKNTRTNWLFCIAVILGSAIIQGFNEPLSVLTIGLYVIILILAFRRHELDRLKIVIAGLIGSILGIAAVYFSPGTMTRASIMTQTHIRPTFPILIRESLYNYSFVIRSFCDYRLLIFISVTICIILTYKHINEKYKNPKYFIIFGLYLTIVPTFLVGFMTSYTGAIEGGFAPNRTATIIMIPTVVGMGILLTGLLNVHELNIRQFKNMLEKYGIPVFLIVASAVTMLSLLRGVEIIKAESLRESLLSYRQQSISSQLRAGLSTISIDPAPILLSDSQAADLRYEPLWQIDWVVVNLRQYYGINDNQTIKINKQADGYCLSSMQYSWYGANSCVSSNYEKY